MDELHTQHPGSIDPDETLSAAEAHEGIHEHITNFWTMTWVFIVLLALTALTVWTSNIHEIVIGNTTIEFGATLHIWVALFIAVIKSVLVGAYFMHLKYDKPMNTVVVGATIFGVVLFIGLTLADLSARGKVIRDELTPIIRGGNKHYNPATGERVEGVGVTTAAEEAGAGAHGEGGGDHGDESHDDEDH